MFLSSDCHGCYCDCKGIRRIVRLWNPRKAKQYLDHFLHRGFSGMSIPGQRLFHLIRKDFHDWNSLLRGHKKNDPARLGHTDSNQPSIFSVSKICLK